MRQGRSTQNGIEPPQALHLSTASLHRLANSPGSKFNRHGGSILNRRQQTCKLGGHNADLVVRLFDGRLLPIECKASNSEVNGYKRLNKEVVVDAKDWSRRYGSDTVIPAAALRGVFKASNVVEAQREGVYIFWWHRMDALAKFLAAAV